METTLVSAGTTQREQDTFRTISFTALLTGTLQLAAANIHYYFITNRGATLKLTGTEEPVSFITYLAYGGPDRVFKYIAGAVFGAEAGSGGKLMIIWGAVFHYMIAFAFTAFLFLIYPKVTRWFKNKYITGLTYGLFIWALMNFAIVPLSKIGQFPPDPTQAAVTELIVTCMVGIPVAWIAHRFYSRKRTI